MSLGSSSRRLHPLHVLYELVDATNRMLAIMLRSTGNTANQNGVVAAESWGYRSTIRCASQCQSDHSLMVGYVWQFSASSAYGRIIDRVSSHINALRIKSNTEGFLCIRVMAQLRRRVEKTYR